MKTNRPFLLLFIGVLGLIICGVTSYILPHLPWIWRVSGLIALLAFAGYVVTEINLLREKLAKKTTRYGLNSIFMSLVFLALMVVLNMIFVNHDIKADLTKNKLHTLSEQSVKIVKNLKEDVTFKAFIPPMAQQEYERVFEKYTYHSPKLKKEIVDVDKDPFAVKKYEVKQLGTIIVESKNRSARVDNLSGPDDPRLEEKLTNAIIQVAKGDKKKIYFLNGHKERLIADTTAEGYSQAKEALESGRYQVSELMLLDKDKVPGDAEIVVIAGPKSEFLPQEYKLLENYLKNGGKMMVMLEPDSTPSMKDFVAKYGANWSPRMTIFESNPLLQQISGHALSPVVMKYDPNQEITRDTKNPSVFVIPTPVEKAQAVAAGYKVDSLFSSSPSSFEVKLEGNKVAVNPAKDKKGPISLAVAVSAKAEKAIPDPKAEKKEDAEAPKEKETRLVVVGDSDFASNSWRKFSINADLFENMLSWLAQEEDLISIRPKATDQSDFDITDGRARIINLASGILLPFFMFAAGIEVCITRSRL